MRVRLLSLLIMFGLLAGSCGAVRPEPLAFVDEDARPGQSILRVATWDANALTPAIEAWEAEHPTARVVVEVLPIEQHHADSLEPGADAPDVVAIDARYGADFRNRTELFEDLTSVLDNVDPAPQWRIDEGTADDGTVTSVAISTGGLALVVRTSLLQEVDDPESGGSLARAVESAETWCDLFALGDRYSESTERAFLPSAVDVFDAVLAQADSRLVDADGNRMHEDSAAVQRAWELAMTTTGIDDADRLFQDPCPDDTSSTERITASRLALTASWEAAIAAGDVAVIPASSWMLENIMTAAPTTTGEWTIVNLPEGPASIGGTSLAIPQGSDHPELARDLIEHLARPTSQSSTFREFGNLPASTAQYDVPAVIDHREPFFGDTPIGERYIDSITAITTAPTAADDEAVMAEFRSAVARVDAGTQTPAEAWGEAIWRIDLLLGDN